MLQLALKFVSEGQIADRVCSHIKHHSVGSVTQGTQILQVRRNSNVMWFSAAGIRQICHRILVRHVTK